MENDRTCMISKGKTLLICNYFLKDSPFIHPDLIAEYIIENGMCKHADCMQYLFDSNIINEHSGLSTRLFLNAHCSNDLDTIRLFVENDYKNRNISILNSKSG